MGNLKASIASGVLATIVAVGNVNAEEQKQIEKQDNKSQIVQVVNKNKTQTNEIIQVNYLAPKTEISKLVFPEDLKTLLNKAEKLGIEIKEKINDEKEFDILKKQTEEEKKRLDELKEFVKDKKVEKYLLVKRTDLKLKITDEEGKDSLDLEKTIAYLREKEKLAQKIEKDFLIVEGADIRLAELDADRAKIQANTAEIGEKIAKLKEERAIIQEEGKKYAERNKKLDEDIVAIRARNAELKKVYEQLSNNGNREIIALKK